MVGHQTFFDDLSDGEAGIQAGVGILEDDLQILTQRPLFLVLQPGQVNAVVAHGLVLGELGIGGILLPQRGQRGFQLDDFLVLGGNFIVQRLDLLFQLFHAAGVAALAMLQLHRQINPAGGKPGAPGAGFIDLQNELTALIIVIHGKEAADDLHDVIQTGLLVAAGQIPILQQVEVGLVLADLLHFAVELGGLFLRLFILLTVLVQMTEGILHIAGSHFRQRLAVIHGRTGRLGIELEQHTAQRTLAAAGLAHHADGLALIDVQRNILIGADVLLGLLEDGGFSDGEILLQISD